MFINILYTHLPTILKFQRKTIETCSLDDSGFPIYVLKTKRMQPEFDQDMRDSCQHLLT